MKEEEKKEKAKEQSDQELPKINNRDVSDESPDPFKSSNKMEKNMEILK